MNSSPIRLIPALFMLALAAPLANAQAPNRGQPMTPLASLQANIERITHSENAKWAVYMKCVETGEEVSVNADEPMDTMSVIKIPLLVEAFRQIEAGKFALTDKVVLKASDIRPGTGVIHFMDPGAQLTIKDVLTLMIVISDNSATDMMFEKVGGIDAVNALMQSYGLTTIKALGTADDYFKAGRAGRGAAAGSPAPRDAGASPGAPAAPAPRRAFGLSSARDMGRLLEMIQEGKAVSPAASAQMLQIMRGQIYSSRLPKYATGFRLAHKTGDGLPRIANDVGIFENADRHIVVAVFTNDHTGIAADLEDAIGRIGEQITDYYNYRGK